MKVQKLSPAPARGRIAGHSTTMNRSEKLMRRLQAAKASSAIEQITPPRVLLVRLTIPLQTAMNPAISLDKRLKAAKSFFEDLNQASFDGLSYAALVHPDMILDVLEFVVSSLDSPLLDYTYKALIHGVIIEGIGRVFSGSQSLQFNQQLNVPRYLKLLSETDLTDTNAFGYACKSLFNILLDDWMINTAYIIEDPIVFRLFRQGRMDNKNLMILLSEIALAAKNHHFLQPGLVEITSEAFECNILLKQTTYTESSAQYFTARAYGHLITAGMVDKFTYKTLCRFLKVPSCVAFFRVVLQNVGVLQEHEVQAVLDTAYFVVLQKMKARAELNACCDALTCLAFFLDYCLDMRYYYALHMFLNMFPHHSLHNFQNWFDCVLVCIAAQLPEMNEHIRTSVNYAWISQWQVSQKQGDEKKTSEQLAEQQKIAEEIRQLLQQIYFEQK